MLSEAALILIVALGACALLILGVLELIWPTRPRYPVRRYPFAGDESVAPRERRAPGPSTRPVVPAPGDSANESRSREGSGDDPRGLSPDGGFRQDS